MALFKVRGESYNVVFRYSTGDGTKLHWETYKSELEAVQRKAYIDYLERNGLKGEIIKAALEYKRKAEIQKRVKEEIQFPASTQEPENVQKQEENLQKTYRQFVEKWLPIHARKKRFSPNTYDNYRSNLNNHILPYFGDQIMSSITAEDIDNFIDYLSSKPCKGSKSYGKKGVEIPVLASSSIKKCYNVLMAGYPSAKKWHYVNEVPETTSPCEKPVKRHAWSADKVKKVLDSIQDDKLLHLAVHLAFVCSLRAGETAGIDVNTIEAADHSFWITRQIQRVSDAALAQIPQEEIFLVFPKQVAASRSSLILKTPKTEGSKRKQYVPAPLMKEIMERVAEIEEHKAFFQEEYHDYGLLICQVDGRPIDPKSFDKWFKEKQTACGIPPQDQIEFQGLRKSGQMHKVRLSQNNYQLVAESAGQSPEVLMSNYNEALDSEKRALSHMVEDNFYSEEEREQFKPKAQPKGMDTIMEMLRDHPELAQQLMQNLLLGALNQTASAPNKKSSC